MLNLALIVAATPILILLTLVLWQIQRQFRLVDAFPRDAKHLLGGFLSSSQTSAAHYEDLFRYFVLGFWTRRSKLGAHAKYPGWPSGSGDAQSRANDYFEGFSRISPLLAAWLCGGRSDVVSIGAAGEVSISGLLRDGLLAGTDSCSDEFWGDITDNDLRIVEAADIALALWLSRHSVWASFELSQRDQIARWLQGVNGKATADNNWHLFIVLINCVLESLAAPFDEGERERRYRRVKDFYRGDGWFRDGASGKFDYYNAWGFHYPLLWIQHITPGWDKQFLDTARREFLSGYKFFFGPHGFPVLGRSICYRMAAPAPLVAAHTTDPDIVSVGEARRALDLVWRYFIQRGALRQGNVTQGYWGSDPRILDSYSGPASCLWSLRSLVAAFVNPSTSEFWRSSGEPLPVERGDFRFDLNAVGWVVEGTATSGDVRILVKGNTTYPCIEPYRYGRRLIDILLGRGQRPSNGDAKYQRRSYSAAQPFCCNRCRR